MATTAVVGMEFWVVSLVVRTMMHDAMGREVPSLGSAAVAAATMLWGILGVKLSGAALSLVALWLQAVMSPGAAHAPRLTCSFASGLCAAQQ